MNYLKRGLEFINALLGDPALATTVLHDNRYWKHRFRKEYRQVQGLPTIPITNFLQRNETLGNHPFLGGGSMVTDLLLLKSLSRRDHVEVYFEIGLWRGESLATVLPYVSTAFTLDLSTSEMSAKGFTRDDIAQMGVLLPADNNVIRVEGDSMYFDFGSIQTKADLVFIDGDHTYDYVLSDTRNVMAHLVHQESIVVWHDYGFDPEELRYEVYKGILDGVGPDNRSRLFHVAHTKCAILLPNGMLDQLDMTEDQVSFDLEISIHNQRAHTSLKS